MINLRNVVGRLVILASMACCSSLPMARADGVCDPSTGWCRMHLQSSSRPFSTVFIRPQDQYGQYRRVWVRFDDGRGSAETTGVTLDCTNATLGIGLGGSGFSTVKPGSLGGEIYESACLGRNVVMGVFPQGNGSYPPPGFVPQGGQNPSLLETILNTLIRRD